MRLNHTVALTDVGRERKHNEDAHLLLSDIGLLAVADGMGGLEHGEVASATAIGTIRAARSVLTDLVEKTDEVPARENRANLGSALEQVTDIASSRIQQVLQGANSGTTLVVGVIAGGHLMVANTGDSRAYLFRQGRIRCLTDDHTVAAARLRAGLLTQEEHDNSPYQHMLYQALGISGEVNPDLFDEPLAMGDIVLLCSDGLTGPVPDGMCEHILEEHLEQDATLDEIAGALVKEANDKGGPDNITVVMARIEDGPTADTVERDRITLEAANATGALESIDLRLLRHYLDYESLGPEEATSPARGLHLVLTGALCRGEERVEPGSFCGVKSLMDGTEEPWLAEGDTRCLTLSGECYELLERRRPKTAARLLRGVLGALSD
ncbi:MAG TPA: protein phosphatase 2C domain-containing protein [Myxococcota bacterium]|nr:protein phosphatase 2C domain-containing protein [Myxococcota bacterium]